MHINTNSKYYAKYANKNITWDSPVEKYKEYASATLGYVKPDDDRKVNISFNVIVDDHFASDKEKENYNAENSFQYWVRGKDITHAMVNYYSLSYYNSYREKIEKDLKESGSVDNSTLKALNNSNILSCYFNILIVKEFS